MIKYTIMSVIFVVAMILSPVFMYHNGGPDEAIAEENIVSPPQMVAQTQAGCSITNAIAFIESDGTYGAEISVDYDQPDLGWLEIQVNKGSIWEHFGSTEVQGSGTFFHKAWFSDTPSTVMLKVITNYDPPNFGDVCATTTNLDPLANDRREPTQTPEPTNTPVPTEEPTNTPVPTTQTPEPSATPDPVSCTIDQVSAVTSDQLLLVTAEVTRSGYVDGDYTVLINRNTNIEWFGAPFSYGDTFVGSEYFDEGTVIDVYVNYFADQQADCSFTVTPDPPPVGGGDPGDPQSPQTPVPQAPNPGNICYLPVSGDVEIGWVDGAGNYGYIGYAFVSNNVFTNSEHFLQNGNAQYYLPASGISFTLHTHGGCTVH